MQEAEGGSAAYLFEILPQVNNVFDLVEIAKKELSQTPELQILPQTVSQPDFQTIIDWIVSLCSAVCIFGIDNCKDPDDKNLDLIIVIPENSKNSFKELKKAINTVKIKGWKIDYSLYHLSQLRKHFDEGSIFHVLTCKEENLLYNGGTVDLSDWTTTKSAEMKISATATFEINFNRGKNFLEGAKSYISKDEKEMAAFMLQQAAEMTLHGMLMAVLGMNVRNHSIMALLKHCNRFTKQLSKLFPNNTAKESSLVKLMESAYHSARYKDDFIVDAQELALFFERVELLMETSESITRAMIVRFLSSNENEIGSSE